MTRPPLNLNPDAMPWGRSIEASVDNNAIAIAEATADLRSASSANKATLDTLAAQIQEVSDRPASTGYYADVVSPSFNKASGDVTVPTPAYLIPEPDRNRYGWFIFTAELDTGGVGSTQADIRTSTWKDGLAVDILQTARIDLPPSPGFPANWERISVSIPGPLLAGPGRPVSVRPQIILRATNILGDGPLRTVTVRARATWQYAQPYVGELP